MLQELGYIGEALLGLAAIVGVAYIAWRKSQLQEAISLADTRGKRIEDLEQHIARMDQRILALEARLDATEALKAAEISTLVVAGVAQAVRAEEIAVKVAEHLRQSGGAI